MSNDIKRQSNLWIGTSAIRRCRRAPIFMIALLLVSCSSLSLSESIGVEGESQDFTKQRRALVDQLKAEGITNNDVLKAMRKVPRHEFVPELHRHYSYQNRPLPIGHDQTIS